MVQKYLFPLMVLVLAACNSYKSKIHVSEDETVLPAAIDYTFVNAKVIQPACVQCHSLAGGNKGDVNLETYENVMANLADIENDALVDLSMPPQRGGGPLNSYQQNVLKLWIEAGAPRSAATPSPTPTPVPVPEPSPAPSPSPVPVPQIVEPTWDSISKNIFEPKCVKCHQAGGKAEDVPLTDRAVVVDPQNTLVKAGAPDESDLYIAVSRKDRKVMPPPKTGMTLSAEEIEAIRQWILNGAKD